MSPEAVLVRPRFEGVSDTGAVFSFRTFLISTRSRRTPPRRAKGTRLRPSPPPRGHASVLPLPRSFRFSLRGFGRPPRRRMSTRRHCSDLQVAHTRRGGVKRQ